MSITMNKSEKEAQKASSIEWLRNVLKPGDRVGTVLTRTAASGMSRRLKVIIIVKEDDDTARPYNASREVARAVDFHYDPATDDLAVQGCGMDAGFEVAYNLGRALFPDGFDLPEGAYGRNGDTSGHDRDGGYALQQSWL